MRIDDVRVIAFEDRQGRFVFVKVPGEYGRYLRCSYHVAVAACPACRSPAGVPCRGQYDRYTGSSHADRHVAAVDKLRELVPNKSGVGKAIAEDGDDPPVLHDDVLSEEDKEPEKSDSGPVVTTVDLRGVLDR